MRILIVEDEPSAASLIQKLISAAAGETMEIQTVQTMHAARNAVLTFRPQCALFDLSLPDSPREESLNAIMDFDAFCPVVVVTGSARGEDMVTAFKNRAMDYLPKMQFLRPGYEAYLMHAVTRAIFTWKRDHAPDKSK